MKLISQAAEAKIYLDGKNIIKDRIKKGYRIAFIDNKLIKQRTKKEAKILLKLTELCPKLISAESNRIVMEYIKGPTLKNILNKKPELAFMAGKEIAKIHSKEIIHGDLTTSNMILSNKKLIIIDFGLSFYSKKTEDQAVDIHLFKQALMSKHHAVYEEAYNYFIDGYKSYKNSKEVLSRLNDVEKRGRYKGKNY
jgi:Kae1-associated kinase Bud32